MLRISQPKIQWQSWPPSADILPCKHIVLSCFAMTAFVANTPTFAGHPSNLALLGRTDDRTSDITQFAEIASRLENVLSWIPATPLPANVPRRCQSRRPSLPRVRPKPMPGEMRAQQGPTWNFTLRRFSASPSNKRQHEPGWRAKPACRHFHYPFATISITPL